MQPASWRRFNILLSGFTYPNSQDKMSYSAISRPVHVCEWFDAVNPASFLLYAFTGRLGKSWLIYWVDNHPHSPLTWLLLLDLRRHIMRGYPCMLTWFAVHHRANTEINRQCQSIWTGQATNFYSIWLKSLQESVLCDWWTYLLGHFYRLHNKFKDN